MYRSFRRPWNSFFKHLILKVLGMKNFLEVVGYCPICERDVTFCSKQEWLRDHFLCSVCGSIPRERALMRVIKDYYPDYRSLRIHESSPGGRGASIKLRNECREYSSSHFFPDIDPGEHHPTYGHRCENIESMTFRSKEFDLFVTQDVMEHIYDPDKAFREIARVLKPGGAHIFTVPLINKCKPTERWAELGEDGQPVFLHKPEYHGNPIDPEGSPVTMHWGYDISQYITSVSSMATSIIAIDDLKAGIRAEFIDVLMSKKP